LQELEEEERREIEQVRREYSKKEHILKEEIRKQQREEKKRQDRIEKNKKKTLKRQEKEKQEKENKKKENKEEQERVGSKWNLINKMYAEIVLLSDHSPCCSPDISRLMNLMKATGPVHKELENVTLFALIPILGEMLTKQQYLPYIFQWTNAMSLDKHWLTLQQDNKDILCQSLTKLSVCSGRIGLVASLHLNRLI